MSLEIDLMEGIKNPEKAKEVVKAVQASIDELTKAAQESLQTAKDANANAEEYHKQVQVLTQSNISLSEAIKAIHMKLNEHADIVDQAEELAEIRKELAKFVLGTGMIKLGVLGNVEKVNHD